MKRILQTLLLALLCTMNVCAEGGLQLTSQRISSQEGLLSNTVYELAQDPEGFVWMATNNGLSRYDGYTTVNYASVSCLPNHPMEARIGRLSCDERNRVLWLSTSTYINACYDLGQARFVDWTGKGDMMRPMNKFFLSTRGMWFYGNGLGVRFSDGRKATDYTKENGMLPSNEVERIMEDKGGDIWIATARGMVFVPTSGRPQTKLEGRRIISCVVGTAQTFCLDDANHVYTFNNKTATLLSTRPANIPAVKKVNISFIWNDRWMLFTPEGTMTVSTKDGSWRQERGEAAVVNGLNQGATDGYHFVADDSGRLWIFADNGRLKVLDLLKNSRFTSNKGRKFNIVSDHEGRLFIATYGNGLFVWNPKTDHTDHFKAEDEQPMVSSNYLLYAMCDRQGNIWVGSEETGAYRLSVVGKGVSHALPEPAHKGDGANTVTAIAERDGNIIIIGTREGGVYQYDLKTNHTEKLKTIQSSIRCLLVDRDKRLWTGTYDRGLYVEGENYCVEDATHRLPVNNVRDIRQDNKGRIWIGTRDGGLLMTDGDTRKPLMFRKFLDKEMNQKRVNVLTIDSRGTMWVGTNDGLYSVDSRLDNITEKDFTGYRADGSLPFSEISALYAAADTTLWVAVGGGGLLKCRTDANGSISYTQITRREGLASNAVYSIVGDSQSYLWVGTDAGISRINTRNGIVNTYQPLPFIQANICVEGSALQTKDGHLLFGTIYGMRVVSPDHTNRQTSNSLADNQANRLTAIVTDLHVNGHSIYEDSTFRQSLSTTPHIELGSQDNSLSFFFSNFAFANIKSSLYQFYLEGIDDTWNPMTTANHADYTELPPGHYTFHLRSLDHNNNWLDETRIEITIHHPWYLRWWAVLIYVMAAMLFIWYVYSNWKEKFDLHQQMKMEKQMTDFRMMFFTNVAHEFRTPLAIIQGAVSRIADTASPGTAKAALQTAQRGTSRLLRLVNQLLDFRRMTTGTLRLKVAEGDMVAFVRSIYQDLWSMANQKSISMQLITSERKHILTFDHDKVETMVYNLLSNAVKYTPEGGSIIVRLGFDNQLFTFSVKDSGPGLSAEAQAHLFQPFMNGLASQGGMGIGLYSAREMARLHHGDISYTTADGGGACFTMTLPDNSRLYQPEEMADANDVPSYHQDDREAEAVIREMMPQAINEGVRVIVIEDDPDMMEQIKSELGVYFTVEGYMNGRQGFDAVMGNAVSADTPTRSLPERCSLLVCDVMLPDMDGYEIVRQVKARPDMRSLPVILLTALGDERHQLKAYKAGADDFVVKPCNWRILAARALQLIKWADANRADAGTATTSAESANGGLSTATPEEEGQSDTIFISHADKTFKKRVDALIASHMADEQFNIDMLAEMMQMGHTKFYGRMREVTGTTPNKYVMAERMRRAADLLLDGRLNVSEVAWKVGFQDQSYFNKCFKAHYGVPPSKYGK
ncbi:MAG: helix-turn-helix domain-containing protein [Prevotella sp.]|nr:helix-turn-helix domain-containing protein [Prevotella sp.]